MPDTEPSTSREAILLCDKIAETLEQAGLWRRAARQWLHIFDLVTSDWAREQVALRREACLLISTNNIRDDRDRGATRRINYQRLLKAQRP